MHKRLPIALRMLNIRTGHFRYIYFWTFLMGIAFLAISLYHREPNEDESVIAGHSYFLGQAGYVKSDLYGGYLEGEHAWEVRQYAYHKLFVLAGTLFIKVFGFNVYSLKSVSLLSMLLFLYVLFRYLKTNHPSFSLPFYWLTCTLFLIHHAFHFYAFTFRPEMMVMTLGFISFYFLVSGINHKIRFQILLAGMFSGLAAFAHLNGLIYSFAGLLLLIANRQYKNGILFCISAGLFTLLYFFDIHHLSELQGLLYQFKTDPNVVSKVPLYMGILNEQIRFFHSPKEIVFSLSFIFSLLVNFKALKAQQLHVLLYLMFLVLGLSMLSHGQTVKYALNYLPYMGLVIVSSLTTLKEKPLSIKMSGGILLIAFLTVHVYHNLKTINSAIAIEAHNAQIASFIPEQNVKISAPSVFAFNEIENYTIRGEIAWYHHYLVYHPNETRTLENYFRFARENKDQYIIIDKDAHPRSTLTQIFENEWMPGDQVFGCTIIKRTPSFVILKIN